MNSEAIAGLDCLTQGHLFVDWMAQGDFVVRQGPPGQEAVVACWCLWCGTAVYDDDLVSGETRT